MHILKTQLVSMYHQLYFLPLLSCFHAHLLALSHIYIYFAHTAGDKGVKTDFMGDGHIFAGCVRYTEQAALL